MGARIHPKDCGAKFSVLETRARGAEARITEVSESFYALIYSTEKYFIESMTISCFPKSFIGNYSVKHMPGALPGRGRMWSPKVGRPGRVSCNHKAQR
jgi:hypothetical protein